MARKIQIPRKWRRRFMWMSILVIGFNLGSLAIKDIIPRQTTAETLSSKTTSRKLLSTVEWEKCDFEVGHARNYSQPSSEWTTPASAYGWVAAYVLATLIVFVALAIVCDDFFVPSLEAISEKLDLSEDVAGATFMAAGSSAPELFTSIAGVTVESDVGVGTIVGSAVFNLLGIVALSAAFAGKVLHLDWRPLARDSLFYALSIICFIIFSWDTKFELYESVIMLALYFAYIVLMKFNPQLMDLLGKIGKKSIHPRENGIPGAPYIDTMESPKINGAHQMEIQEGSQDKVGFAGMKPVDTPTGSPEVRRFSHVKKGQITAFAHGKTEVNSPSLERRTSQQEHHSPTIKNSCEPTTQIGNGISKEAIKTTNSTMESKSEAENSSGDAGKSPDPLFNYKDNNNQISVEEEEDESSITICPCLPPVQAEIPSKPDTNYFFYNWFRLFLGWLLFFVSLPFVIMFTWTIPNCSKPKLRKYYLMSFTMSICWIALLSFAMVTVVGRCGCILGVDRFTMGLVIVAIGTSVPDALSSILVARDGYGDMAVSNAIGSNVFDIDLGLGLPFVISILIRGMKPIMLLNKRDQELYDAGKITIIPHVKYGFILLVILVLTLIVFAMTRFRLNRTLGSCLIFLYFSFVVYSYIQDIYCNHNC